MNKNYLFPIFIILIIWGFFTSATVSFPVSLRHYGNSWHYVLHQLFSGLIPGLIIGFILFKIDLKKLKKLSIFIFGFNLLLLLLVFLPKIGVQINGSRRWLKIGSILFQPSEFLKISFIVYLSAWLSSKLKERKHWQTLLVFLAILGSLGIIFVLQPDLSTLIIIGLTGIIMYFASSAKWYYPVSVSLSGIGAVILLIKSSPYRMQRLLTFLNPQVDPLGTGYQLNQSILAIGSGRLFGIGNGFNLGLSRQKFGFLSQPMTDSIFSVIGEELGFLGSVFLISLFLALAWQGIKMALNTKDEFSQLLSIGIVSWFAFQAFFNIGGIIGILPLAGIPLPFFSYGSSHLVTEIAAVGILLNISSKNI